MYCFLHAGLRICFTEASADTACVLFLLRSSSLLLTAPGISFMKKYKCFACTALGNCFQNGRDIIKGMCYLYVSKCERWIRLWIEPLFTTWIDWVSGSVSIFIHSWSSLQVCIRSDILTFYIMCQPSLDAGADAIEHGRRSWPELLPTTLGSIDFDQMPLEPFTCNWRVRKIIDVVRNYDPAAAGDAAFTLDCIVETIRMQAFANLPVICVMEPHGNLMEQKCFLYIFKNVRSINDGALVLKAPC